MKMNNVKNGLELLLAVVILTGCQSSETQKPDKVPAQQAVAESTPVEPASTFQPVVPKEVSADAPQIKIENTSVDFGQVGPGTRHHGEFHFSNIGKEMLKIDHVQSTCGCTVPQLDKKEYAQGESGIVKVDFQAPAVKGSVVKHLYIISNDPRTPRAELEIKAEVAVKVEIAPEQVELRFDKPNAGMPELTVRSLDNVEFAIQSIIIPNNIMKIPFDPAKKAISFILNPEVDVKLLEKFTVGAIQITTDHPQSGTLLVRYTALPFVDVNRPRIIIQNLDPSVPIVKDVLLRSNYDKPIEIASSESKNGYMAIESDQADGNNRKLLVKITPPAQTSTARRYISDELTITLKSGEKVTIRCSGWYKL